MKTKTKKSVVVAMLVTAVFLLAAGSSCDPESSRPASSASTAPAAVISTAPAASPGPVDQAVEKICAGQFDQARRLLDAAETDSAAAAQLTTLLAWHDELTDLRQQRRREAYQEHLAELEALRDKTAGQDVLDVNDISETMIAVLRVREYAPEDEKDAVLDDPFVRQTLAQMQRQADDVERQGQWVEAYARNYSWLTALHEDHKAYEEKAEELSELATIELSLKDSSCGETAAERYAGIEVVMYLRALNLLENNYVTLMDCREMARAGLRRGVLLGTVLRQGTEELPWSASASAIDRWTEGLTAMQAALEQDAAVAEEMGVEQLADLFQDVLALGAETIALPQGVLIAQFTEASFAAMDPFTNLIWPWNVRDFEKSMTQQFTGIGVEISKETGVLTVVSLLPDKPAYRAGLDADDEILAVEGEPTKDMTIYCAVQKITGPKGTKVTLQMRRPSTGKVWEVTLKRDKIVVDPLRGWTRTADGQWDYLIDPDNRVGYIRLTSFTERTGPDLDSVLRQLEKDGLNGLILDLRFNGGGYLQAAADVVDMFVSEGVIVKSSPRQGFATYEIAHRSGTHPDYPLVVLINGSSASASEIVAGALQDPKHQRATIVGQRSYGKGSVQVVTGYTGDGSQMKYTVAYYHLPSDQRVKNRYQIEKLGRKDWGIAPDVEVELRSNEMRQMIDIQRDNDILYRDDHVENGGDVKRHSLNETLKADPQIATSLLVVRSKMLTQGRPLVLTPPAGAVTETAAATTTESNP